MSETQLKELLNNINLKVMPNIVVTGGSGFVGKNTIEALQKLGYPVLNFDLTEGLDIREYKIVKKYIEKGDRVLHLAAIARFAEADDDPLLAYETNVIGTYNVARACKEKGAERLVYSSTGSVYMPIEEEPPITECFRARGNSNYACSKHLGELMIKKVGVPHIILRYAHLYGEGKIGHGAIGGFIHRMERGLAPQLYGGKQSNDFTYIKDVVQANLLALETDKMNEVYNIGTGEELTTEKVFEIMRRKFKYDKEFERIAGRSVDPGRFVYDISKAKTFLGFNPQYSFEKGLEDYYNTGSIKGHIDRTGKE